MHRLAHYLFTRALPAVAALAAMSFLSSCGGGGGGGGNILGDLNTDMVITQNTTVQTELRAKNLTIADGVTVSSPGDLRIQTSGAMTVNGTIDPTGALTIITAGALDEGTNGAINGGDGDVIIVSSEGLIPTQTEMDNWFNQGSQVGGPKSRAAAGRSGRAGPVHTIKPKVFKPNVKGRNVWIVLDGTVKVGKPGVSFVQTMPPGKDGKDDLNANCTATGTAGSRGGSYGIQADDLEIDGSVTINLGDGGKGGNATSRTDCCPATATGGAGGDTGVCRMAATNAIVVNASLTVNYGDGGAGGTATAIGKDQSAVSSCAPPGACDATATGGKGGKGAFPASSSGNVGGPAPVTNSGGTGGPGGAATATGGAGGTSTCCPAGQGGKGGKATATGGNGGDSVAQISGGIGNGGGFAGGNGGNATPNGGLGGTGSTCCNPPQPGGKGGTGGDASATKGTGGSGTNANGTDGTVGGKAGDGGAGGNGNGPGPSGDGGAGTNVPNGNPGNPGQPCPPSGGCTQEQEPNDTEATGTNIDGPTVVGNSISGCGTLANTGDLDHFCTTLNAGTYRVTTDTKPNGAPAVYLHVGNNQPTTGSINSPFTFTVTGSGVRVYIGYYQGTGNYQFTLTKTQ